ncbi:MAG: type II toxin-antitoxin system HicA family toxin [Candidatus Bathyarchaeia archaeon]
MRLRPVSDKVLKALIKVGFRAVRQRGSHTILRHPDWRTTVVPMHRGEEIGIGLLSR